MEYKYLKQAMGDGPAPAWNNLVGELYQIISSPLSIEDEQLLLQIIHFKGDLKVDESAEGPHSMSPKDMLKSLAIQALVKWKGSIYFTIETTDSFALQSIMRAAIKNNSW